MKEDPGAEPTVHYDRCIISTSRSHCVPTDKAQR
jgi:hypothetical protein